MKQNIGLWFISFASLLVLLGSLVGCPGNGLLIMDDEAPDEAKEELPEGFGSFRNPTMKLECTNKVDKQGNAIGGFATGPGINIEWEGTYKPNAATPLHVLKLAAERMSHLQSTPQSSDANARALFEVLEAIDALEGSAEVSSLVGPGFINPNDGE